MGLSRNWSVDERLLATDIYYADFVSPLDRSNENWTDTRWEDVGSTLLIIRECCIDDRSGMGLCCDWLGDERCLISDVYYAEPVSSLDERNGNSTDV